MHVFRESCSWLIGQTLAAYIVRGVLAVGLFTAGYLLLSTNPVLGVVLVFSALVPIGGCPACWLGGTIGAACPYRPPRQSPPQA
jgi:hypothetical protein